MNCGIAHLPPASTRTGLLLPGPGLRSRCGLAALALVLACRAPAGDYSSLVNVVQDSNGQNRIHKTALMRFPCGRIGLWSIDHGACFAWYDIGR